jgi:carboxylate-amine ligase
MSDKIQFEPNPELTLGVEVELALVDGQTMALASASQQVLEHVPEHLRGCIKPELMQSSIEINSAKCRTLPEADRDLRAKVALLEGITDSLGLRLYWSATHPFSVWQQQQPTPNDRYANLLEILQDMGRRLVTNGLHVHVGLDTGDKAVMICDRILRYLPMLLAVSCNSPWWNRRSSGLQSYRSKIMEGLPTAGMPPLMRNWSEFVWLMNHLVSTGFINSIRDIWWDVRPHPNFGTIEVRVCDMPGNLDATLEIAALIHCLVSALSTQIDEGTYQHDCHPMMVRQNKWRAARYGLDGQLVEVFTYERLPARQMVATLVRRLMPIAESLDCQPYLERLLERVSGSSWADRQLALLSETNDPAEVVRRLTADSRLTPAP